MKTLKIDTAFLETTKELSDVEFGRLFRGMLKYAFSDADVKLGGNERFFWSGVKADIDRQLKAYSARAANMSKARENNPNNNAELLNNKNELLNNSGQERKAEESGKEGEEKSIPLEPPVKENSPEKGKEGEKKNTARTRPAAEEAFEVFWAAYPKKVGKKDAFRAFRKVAAADRPLLVPAVERQKQSSQWRRDGGQYIPNPSTWLNQGRWLDEGLDNSFRAAPKNKVAQELDDFYGMMDKWVKDQEARENDHR